MGPRKELPSPPIPVGFLHTEWISAFLSLMNLVGLSPYTTLAGHVSVSSHLAVATAWARGQSDIPSLTS